MTHRLDDVRSIPVLGHTHGDFNARVRTNKEFEMIAQHLYTLGQKFRIAGNDFGKASVQGEAHYGLLVKRALQEFNQFVTKGSAKSQLQYC